MSQYVPKEGDILLYKSNFSETPDLVINVKSFNGDKVIDINGTEYSQRDLKLKYYKLFLMRQKQ
jgi:hypothetical protein